MTELDVALTDFAIAVEAGAFAFACARRGRAPLRNALTAVFALTAAAAASGGVLHGFASDPASLGYRLLWPTILLAIVGVAAALSFCAVIILDAAAAWRRRIGWCVSAFATAVLLGAQSFALAIGAYAPASLWLAYAFARRYLTTGSKRFASGGIGLVLGIVAGGLQQLGFTPIPGRLSPNAFYHLLQMAALALLFVAGTERAPTPPQTAA